MVRLPRAFFAMACAAFLASAQGPPQTPPRPRPSAPTPSAAPSPLALKYPPLRPIEVPSVATFTLPNGMKVFLLEDRELPVIRGVARVRTGNLFDPAGKVGVAVLTGMAMRTGGTREMTGEQLDRRLEDVAAGVEASIDESAGEVSFFSLAENAADVLGAFRDVLTAPAFRIENVDLAKSQLRSLISRRNDDAGRILTLRFPGIVYGAGSPYGWYMEYEHIDRIARADLQEFYKRYFFPKNTILAVSGDFETAKMKEELEQLFAGWTVEQTPVPEFPKVAAKPAPGIYLAKAPNAAQTLFAIGHLGGTFNDKDFPALTVMANILGGGSYSRLVRQVGARTGNANAISAEWAAQFDHPGLFRISGSTSSISTVAAIKTIQEEVERIRTAEAGDEEVRIARDSSIDSLALAFDTRKQILGRVLNYEYFGYPADFLQRYQKALAAVTRADVLRVAKEYLRPADLTILVAGNPKDFVTPLESLGLPVREIDLAIPEPKAPAPATDTAGLEQGKQILARIQEAVGGAEKIAAVKDYMAVREVRLSAANGGDTLTETERWMAPGNLREDGERAGIRTSYYSDGKSGWAARGRASGLLRGAESKAMQGDIFRSYFSLLLSDRVQGRTVYSLDQDTIEIATAEGEMVQVAVSPETGLPQRISYLLPVAAGPPLLVQETITKFGEVGDLRVPYQFSSRHNGNLASESSVKDFKVNTGLVLADLERRP